MEQSGVSATELTCAICAKVEKEEASIQCDFCDKWYHHKCANVDKVVETRAWWCKECESKCKIVNDTKDDEIASMKREVEGLRAKTERALKMMQEKEAEVSRLCEEPPFIRWGSLGIAGDEWPLFISTFRRSTRTFGFSEDENILRLQSALKGKALRMVQSRLRHTANLEEIISALEKSFGRADVLVNTLLEQIREAPMIRPERLESFIEFGESVAEICATVKASGVSERLHDASLLQEL
uniref:PHD-type domain-containing protein n=1 Tax=Anopheles dirus TaxID=7168 RepID=A0A182NVP0_9DIPT